LTILLVRYSLLREDATISTTKLNTFSLNKTDKKIIGRRRAKVLFFLTNENRNTGSSIIDPACIEKELRKKINFLKVLS
jgi:hypothetical protein|tara:strand:+ start:125 stop:361 length:237 start_codon:yes stop_codon:yes gene_type:complete